MQENYKLDGFQFDTKEEYETAKGEKEIVNYIRMKIDFSNASAVVKIYQKLIEKQSLHTMIGLSFLKELRDKIVLSDIMEEKNVQCILVKQNRNQSMGDSILDRQQKINETKFGQKSIQELSRVKRSLKNARIVIVAACMIIIAMFAITFLGKNTPLLDAETKIQNKYAAWEEELKARETEIQKREEEQEMQNAP